MPRHVPEDPDLFFTEFFPAQYAAYPAFPRTTTLGSAAFEVTGVGAWSLRVAARRLEITRGIAPDCVLSLTTPASDFGGLFVERAEEAIRSRGELPDELRRVFFPLFIDERKKGIAESVDGGMILLLKEDDTDYRLSITPGGKPGDSSKASVRLLLSDFLGLAAGKKKVPLLLAMGRISVRGDVGHALKLSALLG